MTHRNIVRSEQEIGELLNQCWEVEASGRSRYFGMTYEQGIRDGILWLTDTDEERPLEAEEEQS